MALDPHSEPEELSVPEDYHADHPEEHPSDWGWHGEWGRASQIAGWIVLVILLLMITATHYNDAGTFALSAFAIILFIALSWDIYRRRNAWRR